MTKHLDKYDKLFQGNVPSVVLYLDMLQYNIRILLGLKSKNQILFQTYFRTLWHHKLRR